MAGTITSIDASISKLAPTFQTAIKTIIDSESTSLKNVQTQKDKIDVRRGIYKDVKTNFDELQSSIQALISTQASFGLSLVSKATVTPGTVGTTVLSATTKDTAITADYDIAVTQLAKAQSRSTIDSFSPDAAAGKSGIFWLGGTGAAVADRPVSFFTPNTTVTGASPTGSVASGQRELGTGLYKLETRDSGGVRQFRLVNADGNGVSILSQSGTSYTSDWQIMTDGSYDTGRGLSLTLSATGTSASTSLTYTAAGTSINIGSTDSLRTITAAINAASQPEGRDLKASIVANKLVITGAKSGENHTMLYTDSAGLGFGANSQTAQNAKFTVNGMDVSRATNANLSDVVDGATITLASDAEGKSARLSISATTDKASGLISTMVSKFNTALSHLKDKLASTPTTSAEGKTIYTRGPLTGETSLSSLRLEILDRMNRSYTNGGSLKTLSEVGISFDKDMKLTFDSAKFSAAFKSKASDVTALLDAGLSGINTIVSNYAGTSGTLSKALTSIDDQRTSYDKRITKYNETLTARKQSLYNQYYGYQNQLVEYGYQQQMFNAMYGTGTNVNSSG